MTPDLVRILVEFAIQLLGYFIPVLGGFSGGILGWLAGTLITWSSKALHALVERAKLFNDIDVAVKQDLEVATEKHDALLKATEETHDQALSEFMAAVGKLSHIKLR